MLITFAEKIVQLKVYIMFSQSDDLDLHPTSTLRLRLDKFFYVYHISNISDTFSAVAFKVEFKHSLYSMLTLAPSLTLTLTPIP